MNDILTVHHVGYACASIEETMAFWCDVIGFPRGEIQSRTGWIHPFLGIPDDRQVRLVHLIGYGIHIEFFEITPGVSAEHARIEQPGTPHVCVHVTDIEAMRDRVLAAGGTLQGELVTITSGISQGSRGLAARDPNGIIIELVQPASPA